MSEELKQENYENPDLKQEVQKTNDLKTMLVEYVGNLKNPEDGGVTLEMLIEVMANEFPEFLLAVAEENYIRGYEQALTDLESEVESEESK